MHAILHRLFETLQAMERIAPQVNDNPVAAYSTVLAAMLHDRTVGAFGDDLSLPAMLIVDEAQRLDYAGLTALSDLATDGVPTVIAGGAKLQENLFGAKTDRKGQEWAAVHSVPSSASDQGEP